jgi:hypothetical protein
MRAPVVRVTIGDYLYRVPGFLENVNITIDNSYPWEVNLEKSQIGDIAQLPQVMDIAVSFKPIMDILPRRSYITDVSRTTVAGTETTRAYSKNTALISNVEGFIDEETSNITNNRLVEGNNPFASNFERSLESRLDVRNNNAFTFTPPTQTTVTRPRNNNPFASNFERNFNLNVGG